MKKKKRSVGGGGETEKIGERCERGEGWETECKSKQKKGVKIEMTVVFWAFSDF